MLKSCFFGFCRLKAGTLQQWPKVPGRGLRYVYNYVQDEPPPPRQVSSRYFQFLTKQRTNAIVCTRLAIATFWRTFHHDGKISPAGEGGECTPTPYTITAITYNVVVSTRAPAERADSLPLFLLYPYIYSARGLRYLYVQDEPCTVK